MSSQLPPQPLLRQPSPPGATPPAHLPLSSPLPAGFIVFPATTLQLCTLCPPPPPPPPGHALGLRGHPQPNLLRAPPLATPLAHPHHLSPPPPPTVTSRLCLLATHSLQVMPSAPSPLLPSLATPPSSSPKIPPPPIRPRLCPPPPSPATITVATHTLAPHSGSLLLLTCQLPGPAWVKAAASPGRPPDAHCPLSAWLAHPAQAHGYSLCGLAC